MYTLGREAKLELRRTTINAGGRSVTNNSNNFRDLLFPLDSPRLTGVRGLDPYTYSRELIKGDLPKQVVDKWVALAEEPYRGITTDGQLQTGLFRLADEGAPVAAMTAAAQTLLARLSDPEREKLCCRIDGPQWRHWSNPEFMIRPGGLRLEELSAESRNAVLGLLRASLSPAGYEKARGCMLTNAFLGELCNLPALMNEWSYNFVLFGEPSAQHPWGWSLYGHHLVLNCFVLGRQMVISPTFMGAEPNVIDAGPHAGLSLFNDEEQIGLELMRSLPDGVREKAITYYQMQDPKMPPERYHPADQRHMAGAFRDNRIIPYEGVPVGTAFSSRQREQLMTLVAAYVGYLPPEPLRARLDQIERHLDQTWWSWIGGYGDADPFYYRIQSPVVLIEFDHHSGVWLNNQTPAKCHIHTVVRTPNGNDYGKDLLRQHYAHVHPGHAPGKD